MTPARTVFEILVREHADMLETYLRALLGRSPAVDDIFQEAMLVAWRRLSDYNPSRPFGAWLRGIAQVLVMEHARKSRAAAIPTEPAVLAALDTRFELFGHTPGDSFPQRTERLFICISRLPELLRQVIDLVYARGLSLGSAAQSLGASEEAVKKRVQRARALLAECLTGSAP